VLALLQKRGRRILFRSRSLGDETTKRLGMSQYGSVGGNRGGHLGGSNSASEGRERGARRRKIVGYLKAANDLRQSYQQSYGIGKGNTLESDVHEDEQGIPGAFPDVAVVRSGDEEMVLFPSYARRHVKKENPPPQNQRPTSDATGEGDGGGATLDAAFWREQWERREDDKAIADIDVRGWIYSPHRGPMSRRNRLLIGLARRLSGIPAPPSAGQSLGSGGDGSDGDRQPGYREGLGARREEDLIRMQADSILKKGEGEADVAGMGEYSEDPGVDSDRTGAYNEGSGGEAPNPSSTQDQKQNMEQVDHTLADSSLRLERDSPPEPGTSATHATPSSQMTPTELSAANAQLMARLKPFMTVPLVNTPITVFFYNSQTSQSRTVMTNDAGHFSVRAALDFVPTHVRVLASEDLSATEEVRITEPTGVSMISDIDDTIKHSAIGGGAREMFRNTFVRDLGELTIRGVKEWYNKLADMGVGIHYVSNSPWQLYPLLVTYFSLAGLPPGSFHLKQYSGMLQGIFEPVAERKKGTLETIMRDFPDRKFLLIGDSGEADLEVYTDVVLANPGRVVGIFIRDITTPPTQGFFDSAMGPLSGERSETGNSTSGEKSSGTTGSGSKPMPMRKPVLPPRPTQPEPQQTLTSPTMGKLIDFDDGDSDPLPSGDTDKPPRLARSMTEQGTSNTGGRLSTPSSMSRKPQAPMRPSKPIALRGSPTLEQVSAGAAGTALLESYKKPPPVPPKPKLYLGGEEPSSKPRRNVTAPASNEDPPAHRQGYIPSIRGKVSSVYNSLPSASDYWYGTSSGSQEVSNTETRNEINRTLPSDPPLPPRKGLTAYPVAAAHYATNRLSGGWSGNTATTVDGLGDENSVVNKKEELWKRRWARAKGILDNQGVMLRSWRTGEDVLEEAVRLVERVRDESSGEGKEGRG
jgi:phosphatidate phosphatase APP1